MNKENILKDLRQTVYDLLTDLSYVFTLSDEKDDLAIIGIFYKKLDSKRIMSHTIKKLLPHKTQIEQRDIHFFDENRYIFAGLPDHRVSHYRDAIFVHRRISEDNMDVIWEYLDAIIVFAELYTS